MVTVRLNPTPTTPLPPLAASAKAASSLAHQAYEAMNGGMTGWGTDEAKLFSVLQSKDLDAVRRDYNAHYKRDFDTDVLGELGGAAKVRAQALLGGSTAEADAAKTPEAQATELRRAMKGGLTGAGTDEDAVFAVLDQKSPAERGAVVEAYGKLYGTGSLERDLKSELGSATRDRALSLLANDQSTADAHKVRDAMNGGWTGAGTDVQGVQDAFEGKSDGERRAIVQAYDARYGAGALSKNLRGEMGVHALGKTEALIERGKLSDVEAVRFAIAGVGTDEDALVQSLQGKSKAEIEQISADYKAKYGREMSSDISWDVTGRLEFDTAQLQKGAPQSAEETVERINENHAFERSGLINGVSRAVMDQVSPEKGQTLNRNKERANEIVKNATIAERPLSEAEKAELAQIGGWVEQDVSSYRAAKDTAGEVAGTGAATVATIGVVAASGGTATPAVIALAGLAGGTANVTAKAAIGGAGYGAGDAVIDGAVGAVDGVFGVTGPGSALARKAVQGSATRALARGGVKGASEEVLELAGRDLMERSVTRRMAVGALKNGADGAAGGAAGGAVSTGLSDKTWDDGLATGAQRVAAGAAGGAAVGGVVGGSLGGVSDLSGRRLDGVDQAKVVKKFSEGDNHWQTIGNHDDVLTVNRALDRAPVTLSMTAADGSAVKVIGAKSQAEVANVQSALERMREIGGDRAIPSEVHVRNEIGAITDAAGNQTDGIGGLAGDGRHVTLSRDALKDPKSALHMLAHETGHNLDTLGGGLSDDVFGHGESVSAYGALNPAEDFAETHRVLIEKWDQITGAPELYVDNGTDIGKKFRFILDNVYGDKAPKAPEALDYEILPKVRPGTETRPWQELGAIEADMAQTPAKLESANNRLAAQEAQLETLSSPHVGTKKPAYENPGHHELGNENFRGGGSMTTPLPKDAEKVFESALPEPGQNGRVWWGKADSGDWYRFSGAADAPVHWNGATGKSGGARALGDHDVPGQVARRQALPAEIANSRAKVDELQKKLNDLPFEHAFATLEMEEARKEAALAATKETAR